jgi:hypothetical protein
MCRLVYQDRRMFPILVAMRLPNGRNQGRLEHIMYRTPEEIPLGACFSVIATRYEAKALMGV